MDSLFLLVPDAERDVASEWKEESAKNYLNNGFGTF